ncbi:protein Mis18-beta [Varanus komodoensis]|uniref:protein Mis18-beta n=1 Tax=Varanus komodoensis TaxID=61221 RepID=UPI001CF7C452|nr:protein Mis18-beta [Varanus komodoensis]
MAVRRQLRLLFQEPQVSGAIMVERLAPRTAKDHNAQQSAKAPGKPAERVPGARGLRLEDCALYQCRRCRAVLGDSLHLCAQEDKFRLLVCFKVTNDVVVEDNLMVCVEGDLIGCTYNRLNCRFCKTAIGFRPYSSRPLAYLRGLFCLFKDNITCYSLKSKTTVEASQMTFPQVSLKEHVHKLKESLVLMHMRIELLIKKLEQLNKQRTVAEKQTYKGTPHGQASGSTRKKLNN